MTIRGVIGFALFALYIGGITVAIAVQEKEPPVLFVPTVTFEKCQGIGTALDQHGKNRIGVYRVIYKCADGTMHIR